MSFLQYEVVAAKGFLDLNVYPEKIPVGGKVVVDEQTYNSMKKSDPDSIELVQTMAPNPRLKKKATKSE